MSEPLPWQPLVSLPEQVHFDFAAAEAASDACGRVRVALQTGTARRRPLVAAANEHWQGPYHDQFVDRYSQLQQQSGALDEQLAATQVAITRAAAAAHAEQQRFNQIALQQMTGPGALAPPLPQGRNRLSDIRARPVP